MPLTQLNAGGTVWQLLGMLFVVIAILALAWLATRWIAARSGGVSVSGASRASGEDLAVLAQLSLGRNERLLLVRLGQKCLLLGVTQQNVSLLGELTGEEAAQWFTEPAPRPSFLEALQENLRKKK